MRRQHFISITHRRGFFGRGCRYWCRATSARSSSSSEPPPSPSGIPCSKMMPAGGDEAAGAAAAAEAAGEAARLAAVLAALKAEAADYEAAIGDVRSKQAAVELKVRVKDATIEEQSGEIGKLGGILVNLNGDIRG